MHLATWRDARRRLPYFVSSHFSTVTASCFSTEAPSFDLLPAACPWWIHSGRGNTACFPRWEVCKIRLPWEVLLHNSKIEMMIRACKSENMAVEKSWYTHDSIDEHYSETICTFPSKNLAGALFNSISASVREFTNACLGYTSRDERQRKPESSTSKRVICDITWLQSISQVSLVLLLPSLFSCRKKKSQSDISRRLE